jgi:hypothetical protein
MRQDNHVIVNLDNQKWGRGHNFAEAMKNAKAKLKDRMHYYIFKNDDWDILDTGTVTFKMENLINRQYINL